MKKLLLISALLITLFMIGCNSPSGIIEVDSNLMAERLKPGQVYSVDFMMEENYMLLFVKTIILETFSFDGTTISYKQSQNETDYTPYFAWICYPQHAKSSRATIIFLEDIGGTIQESGDFTVRAVARMDTSRALIEFGGTYGTNQQGW